MKLNSTNGQCMTMKTKTSELIGAALDWTVAKCEGVKVIFSGTGFLIYSDKSIPTGPLGRIYQPSAAWAQGGPIIERERIDIKWDRVVWVASSRWIQDKERVYEYGPTPLHSAMRCYVASKLGDTVEVPEELCVKVSKT